MTAVSYMLSAHHFAVPPGVSEDALSKDALYSEVRSVRSPRTSSGNSNWSSEPSEGLEEWRSACVYLQELSGRGAFCLVHLVGINPVDPGLFFFTGDLCY